MRNVPNDIVQTLIRALPVILDNIGKDAERSNLRLCNAVRLTKKIINRLNKIEYEQSNNNSERKYPERI